MCPLFMFDHYCSCCSAILVRDTLFLSEITAKRLLYWLCETDFQAFGVYSKLWHLCDFFKAITSVAALVVCSMVLISLLELIVLPSVNSHANTSYEDMIYTSMFQAFNFYHSCSCCKGIGSW